MSDDIILKEMQHVLLDILVNIDRVCREHGLRYYLLSGTMLGAVRHKGFIPWDDDADVALPRKDYNELMAHAKEWLPEDYELVNYENSSDYPYAFARIQDRRTTYILRRHFNFVGGVPVDVFPLDGMTTNKLMQHYLYRVRRILIKLSYYTQRDPYKHGHGPKSWPFLACRKLISSRWVSRQIERVESHYDFDKSPLVIDHDLHCQQGIQPKAVYGTPTPAMFEGHTFLGMADPDAYLRHVYGNYMEPPAVMPPCNYRYMDLHKPYREYLKSKK